MISQITILNSENDKNKSNETSFYRLIFVGDSEVGKTQIINLYNNKLFQNEYFPTFNIDFQIKTLNINGKKKNIHCIDTEGSLVSQVLTEYTGENFIKKIDALIIVYDITSRQSFNNIDSYYKILESKYSSKGLSDKFNKTIKYVVGNKFDLRINRVISDNEGRETENKYNAKYMECSAKNGYNIDRLFEYIIQDIIRGESNNSSDSGGNQRNNNITHKSIKKKSNESVRNNNLYGNNSDNESRQNFMTNSYFSKTGNFFNNNNDYNINNINQNNEIQPKSFYQNDGSRKCEIF
jgi:small GTP-binding protein